MTEERTAPTVVESDVIVVGAGPGGSATAKWLADRGLNVSLLEKSAFPRDKVCGDGLTPRATKQLIRLGVDVSTDAGWVHNIGLRTYAGRTEPFEFLWPELASFPNYGLTRKRGDFDEMLARLAVKAGATLYEETNASEPILDAASDRIVGVRAKDGREFRAPIVVAADGNSSRIALAMDTHRRIAKANERLGRMSKYARTPTRQRQWDRLWKAEEVLDHGLTLAWQRLSGLEARLSAAGRIKKGDLADG